MHLKRNISPYLIRYCPPNGADWSIDAEVRNHMCAQTRMSADGKVITGEYNEGTDNNSALTF